MNTKTTYTFNGINYGFSITNRNWVFSVTPINTLFVSCRGKEQAEKVAHVIFGSLKRTKGVGLDNLARANINTIVGD